MTLTELYTNITREAAPAADLEYSLTVEDPRRRQAIRLLLKGKSYREIGDRMDISHGSAQSLVKLALLAMRKRLLDLPRYHRTGHPGPGPAALAARWPPPPTPKRTGRPPLPNRCPCGIMTRDRASKRNHRCQSVTAAPKL